MVLRVIGTQSATSHWGLSDLDFGYDRLTSLNLQWVVYTLSLCHIRLEIYRGEKHIVKKWKQISFKRIKVDIHFLSNI